MQYKSNNSESQISAVLAIDTEIDNLREQLDILGKSKDDRPNYIKALYPNKIDAIRSNIWDAINKLNFKKILINGTVRVTVASNQTVKNYA